MRILPSIALLTFCLSLDLRAAGELDTSFNPNANGEIKAVAVAPDGKIMIGGAFTNVGGRQQAGVTRLLPTGQPDLTWIPPTTAADVRTCAVFGDGSVAVVAPYFQRTSAWRLKPDGSLDSQFEVRLSDGEVRAMAVDIDGNLLLGGNFNMPSGSERRGYAVVEPSGEVRGKYYPVLGGKSVNTLLARSDGSTIMGGDFSRTYGGTDYAYLQRMTSDASLDSEFRPPLSVAEGKSVDCIAFQQYEIPWIIAGGSFNVRLSATVTETRCLARFSKSGSRDSTFNPVFTRPNGVPRVSSVAVQCDGKIIVAGDFTAVNGVTRLGLVRLNASGSVDTTFVVKDATGVTGLALQADGKVLVTGTFQQINGVTRNRIARLNNDPNRDSLSIRQNEIIWSRVGSMPESDLVSFEVSSDAGKSWQMLKTPTRGISTTWRLSGINLPPSGMVRARARVSSGLMNGSSGIAEKVSSYSLTPEISMWWRPEGLSWISLTDGQTEALDYGEIAEGSPVTKSFSISNTGLYDLNVTGVQLPVGFSLVDPPVFPLALGGQKSVTFGIQADASAHGAIGGTVIVTSDDVDESSFEFPLTAKVIGPEIAMHLGEVELSNGQTAPISFAQGYQGTQQLRETVVVSNQGNHDLNVSAISVGAGFTVDKPEPFLLQPGESRAIQVGPDQSLAGTLSG
ncbi:MAG: choice-of-anchor D domain-containing protein, partial [Verrucomicrobiaceae bacterium]